MINLSDRSYDLPVPSQPLTSHPPDPHPGHPHRAGADSCRSLGSREVGARTCVSAGWSVSLCYPFGSQIVLLTGLAHPPFFTRTGSPVSVALVDATVGTLTMWVNSPFEPQALNVTASSFDSVPSVVTEGSEVPAKPQGSSSKGGRCQCGALIGGRIRRCGGMNLSRMGSLVVGVTSGGGSVESVEPRVEVPSSPEMVDYQGN